MQLFGARFPTPRSKTLEIPDILAEERTPLVETLLALLRVQHDRIQQLEATLQQLRDEIALLKGQKPRPDLRPSLLEAPRPKTAGPEGSKRPRSAKRPKTAELPIHREVPLHPEGLPAGATFRGYQPYVVQELVTGMGTSHNSSGHCGTAIVGCPHSSRFCEDNGRIC